MSNRVALLGWSLPAIESMQKMNKPFVMVSFTEFEDHAKENEIPFVGWNFREWNEQSNSLQLKELLDQHDVDHAVPLFEETVEWAAAHSTPYIGTTRAC